MVNFYFVFTVSKKFSRRRSVATLLKGTFQKHVSQTTITVLVLRASNTPGTVNNIDKGPTCPLRVKQVYGHDCSQWDVDGTDSPSLLQPQRWLLWLGRLFSTLPLLFVYNDLIAILILFLTIIISNVRIIYIAVSS